jgi:AcrR family transcriptional regulator
MELVAQANLRRDTYHHGDLAHALTVAATDLARQGGPEAVVLREAARQVGVSATAAYRHFAGHGDLIHEVKEQCQAALAEHMRAELATGEPAADERRPAGPAQVPAHDPRERAVQRLRALGRGYIRFALAEPGLFRTAFCRTESPREKSLDMIDAPAFAMLAETLDELAELGMIPAERRPYAEMVAWSTAHGLAALIADGPLSALPDQEREAAISRTIDAIVAALTA